MAVPATISDLQVNNLNVAGTCILPANCVTKSNFTGSGSSALEATKVQQQRTYPYSQDRNNYNAADWKALQLVFGAVVSIDALWAKLPVACTSGSTVTVTWRKNGTSIGSVTFTDADAANLVRTAVPSDTAGVVENDISVQITVTGGTPGKGIMAFAKTTEYGS